MFSDNCTKLQSLYVKTNMWEPQPEGWLRLTSIVQNNPRLQRIKVHNPQGDEDSSFTTFLGAVSCCSDLREFRINGSMLDQDRMDAIFNMAANRLECLSLNGKGSRYGSLEKWPCFPFLRDLGFNIDLPSHVQLEIMRRCPELRKLSWYRSAQEQIPVADVCEIFKTHCPLIEELELSIRACSDEDYSRILDSCRGLTLFRLHGVSAREMTFQSLARHFSSLRVLDLYGCYGFTSKMIQHIMTHCSTVRILQAGTVEACDILGIAMDEATLGTEIEPRPPPQQQQQQQQHSEDWICTNLVQLNICISGLQGKPLEWHQRVFQQLAKLTKLERLYLRPIQLLDDVGGLDLRLEAGIGALASLKRLKELSFQGKQQMEEQDVRWMLDAWPKLELLAGQMNTDNGKWIKLRKIVEQAKVAVSVDREYKK
ncbi:hypothetical protein B0O80DRAFT_135185 [Mortierella sp. GBAus27b]|nr:hypothetical protein BGX31_011007 [Mortierella sp. GBA43]KAI8349960.1 hypothetical protein B0O80DRAFT_135185 [Mortierella sp. GBAus27b]